MAKKMRTGNDLVHIPRFEKSLSVGNFIQKVFHPNEIAYCESKPKGRTASYAARFAAKEAFAKALGTGIRKPATFENIGIGHDDLGKPVFDLAPELQACLEIKSIQFAHLSISDEKAFATAFVVLEK